MLMMVTDRPCYSVSSNRALLAGAVTWPRMISMCCLAVILVIDGNSTVMLCVFIQATNMNIDVESVYGWLINCRHTTTCRQVQIVCYVTDVLLNVWMLVVMNQSRSSLSTADI